MAGPRDALAATFFLAQARAADPEDRGAVELFLEAAIVNGRAVWNYYAAHRASCSGVPPPGWVT